MTAACPWPTVTPCEGHPTADGCRQCDGRHAHQWQVWTPPGAAWPPCTRCTVCGAHKCAIGRCLSRTGHQDPHDSADLAHVVPVEPRSTR